MLVEHRNVETYYSTKTNTDGTDYNKSRFYLWSYQLERNRWDLWELCEGIEPGKPFIDTNGKLCTIIGDEIFEYLGSKEKRLYSILTKKESLGVTTQDKVFKRIKITGPKNRLTLPDRSKVVSGRTRNYKHNADKIIVSTDKGRIDKKSF